MSHVALRLLTVAVLFTAAAGSARADITWNITYSDDGRGVGFDSNTTIGLTRQATIDAVTDYINTVIDADGTINFSINASQTDGSGFLATAGSSVAFFSNQTGFVDGTVFTVANGGSDPFPTSPDGDATFDFGFNWNSELSAPTAGEVDLFSVALHELTHALGFASAIESDTSSFIKEDLYLTFDSFLRDAAGNPLIDAAGNFIADVSVLTSGAVFFETLAGDMIELYAPNPWQEGSSISHVDLDDSLMSFAIAPGETQRTYSADELAMLGTMGFAVAAVPEPSSLVLLGATVAGFGLCRLRRRRSRRDVQTAA